MFYCSRCGEKNGWPGIDILIPQSYGECECCGRRAVCNDVPSKFLPIPKKKSSDRELRNKE